MGQNPISRIDPEGLINPGEATCVDPLQPICWASVAADLATMWGVRAAGGAAVAATSNCPNPRCKELEEQIRQHVEGMERKYFDLVTDNHDLFELAYSTNPGGSLANLGTYKGHLTRYDGLRRGLATMVAEAEALGCKVPDKAYELLSRPAPTRPYWR